MNENKNFEIIGENKNFADDDLTLFIANSIMGSIMRDKIVKSHGEEDAEAFDYAFVKCDAVPDDMAFIVKAEDFFDWIDRNAECWAFPG